MTKKQLELIDGPYQLVAPKRTLVSRRQRINGTVYLLLDTSSSMADGQKLEQLKRGALRFFGEAWQRGFAVGAIAFASQAWCLKGATRNFYQFQRRIVSLEAGGRTAMASALRLGIRRLRWRRKTRIMVLITDGQAANPVACLEAAAYARSLGIELIVIGTEGADEPFLRDLNPKLELMHWVKPDDLEKGFVRAAQSLQP